MVTFKQMAGIRDAVVKQEEQLASLCDERGGEDLSISMICL